MPALLGGLIFYHLAYAAAVAFVIGRAGWPASTPAGFSAVLLPLGLALAAGVLLVMGLIFRSSPRRPVAAAQFAGAAFFFLLVPGLPSVQGLLPAFILLALMDALGHSEGLIPRRVRWPTRLGLLVLAAWIAVVPSPHGSHHLVNHLGLFASAPNREEFISFEGPQYAGKDNYPPCVFRYNSFGWRDEEPVLEDDRRLRILIVGDSFVWGDGIPTNEETIAYRLREHLEELAPGRTIVMSAARPGLDLYGYARYVNTLVPLWSPDLVLVSYLGESDLSLLDAQHLLDALPRSNILRGLLLHHRVLQHIHQSSVWRRLHDARSHLEYYQGLLDSMVSSNRQLGASLVLLDYSNDRGWGIDMSPVHHWRVPEQWRYAGESSDLWYALDHHPKPPLIDLLAQWLAKRIVESEGLGEGFDPGAQPATSEARD